MKKEKRKSQHARSFFLFRFSFFHLSQLFSIRLKPARTRLLRVLLLAVTLLTFCRLFTAEFVKWDDAFTLHHNPKLNPPSWSAVAGYWRDWRTGEFGLYIPLTYTVWSGIAALGTVGQSDLAGITLNPWVFHAANVLVHAISALLVFEILVRLLRSALGATLGAMLLAIHPVQVEPVAWASGMKDLLSGMLALGAVLQYLIAAQHDSPRRARLHFILASVLAALAMLAKPSAVVVGPICVVLDALLMRRSLRKALISAAPMLLIAIPVAIIARMVQDVNNVQPAPLWARVFIAADAITFYLYKLVMPLHLALDYGRRPDVVFDRAITYVIWIIPAAVAIALWRWGRREIIAAALIFLLALLPVLGLTTFLFQQYSTVADHYLYLAMLGPALALGWLITKWPARSVIVTASVLIALLAARSFAQTRHWLDDLRLFPHVLRINPQSFAAHNNLGLAYEERAAHEQAYAAAAEQEGDLAQSAGHARRHDEFLRRAAEHFSLAADLNPRDPTLKNNRDRVIGNLDPPATGPH